MIKQLTKAVLVSAMLLLPLTLNVSGTSAQSAEGQIEGGNIYRVRNLTDGGAFADSVQADKCETVQFRVRIHDPGPSPLSQVYVKADINPGSTAATTHVSTVKVSSQNADPSSTSDTASVNISTAQKLTYVAGTSELLDDDGNFLSTIGNVTEGVGVNIGNVGVSIDNQRLVQFKAKINCPEEPCEDNPDTPEDECNPCVDKPETPMNECKPEQPEEPQQPKKPEVLPNTGPGAVAATFFGISSMGALLHRLFTRRF